MPKKKVDQRVRQLIQNAVQSNTRAIFVIVGDKGREQVVNLHYVLSKERVRARPNVLWMYKSELGFSSNYQKRMRQMQKLIKKGLKEADKEDPFELFVSSTSIRYAYYRDSHKVLGQTFGMCILQDFEALTPNLMARTIETVEGGGLVIFLLKTMSSLKQLYTLSMDSHAKFATTAYPDVKGRFNERFILSLTTVSSCLVCDDELNVLPITTHIRQLADNAEITATENADAKERAKMLDSLQGSEPSFSLISLTRTSDQAKVVLHFLDAISEKSLSATVSVTAARGRGKSAAMGIGVAGAIALGYSNIFVTSPHPDNLRTFFEFVLKGLDSLDFEEHKHYETVISTHADFNKAIIRINIFKAHRQTIQFILPSDYAALSQAELLIVDEAAAIPLPTVRKLFGPYLIFLSSTVNGYEGTGRSLSLKLLKQLRQQSTGSGGSGSRKLNELTLSHPIRYALNDSVEKWLNDLLCLDAATIPLLPASFPAPEKCSLYAVDRDTLFSFHKGSEIFLQRLVALFVASHYKNTPNDLLLMADAPAHRLFVLLGPVDKESNTLPEVLCAIQVSLEGSITKKMLHESTSRGERASGDLIPWTVSQQFQDENFPQLNGARIVRIATHPEYMSMGYGSRALQALIEYYRGDIVKLSESEASSDTGSGSNVGTNGGDKTSGTTAADNGNLLLPRRNLNPLLIDLKDRRPEQLDWLGVSYGLTLQLYKFWHRAGFQPVYLRQSASDTTGEHSCIMLREVEESLKQEFLPLFHGEFKRRMISLLPRPELRTLPLALSVSLLDPPADGGGGTCNEPIREGVSVSELLPLSAWDLRRLSAYSRSLVDCRAILDLIPALAVAFFSGKLRRLFVLSVPATRSAPQQPAITLSLSAAQCAILCGLGIQFMTLEDIASDLTLQVSQVLAMLTKVCKRMLNFFNALLEREAAAEMADELPQAASSAEKMQPLSTPLEKELTETAKHESKKRQRDLDRLLGAEFKVPDADFSAASTAGEGSATISVQKLRQAGIRSSRSSGAEASAASSAQQKSKKRKKDKKHKKHKK